MASAPTTSTAGHKPVTTEHQQASPLKALWRIVTHIDRSKINAWQALRNTVGLIAPLIAGYALGMPRGGLAMASGALNVSYSMEAIHTGSAQSECWHRQCGAPSPSCWGD